MYPYNMGSYNCGYYGGYYGNNCGYYGKMATIMATMLL